MKTNRYQKAGVNIEAGNQLVDQIKKDVQSTQRIGADGKIGEFGGMFDLSALGHYRQPVLVSGTDAVGTKLMIAQMMDHHSTIGIDCVAMCANDILVQGAEPLFFLDYIATGKNDPDKLAEVVKGVAAGCRQAGMAIIGGETAEMPGMYPANEYDIAGFGTGIAERDRLLTTDDPQADDVLIGIASSGLHSNGFSLVRQILFDQTGFKVTDQLDELDGQTLGEALLTPTKIYVQSVLPLVKAGQIHGIAHITGGGLLENVPRMFASNLKAEVTVNWPIPAIFNLLQKQGNLDWHDCFLTFNMGIGLVLAVAPQNADTVLNQLRAQGETAWMIGKLSRRQANQASIKILVDGGEIE